MFDLTNEKYFLILLRTLVQNEQNERAWRPILCHHSRSVTMRVSGGGVFFSSVGGAGVGPPCPAARRPGWWASYAGC